MTVELRVPSAGESITEVQVGQWLKGEGDRVERDEAVVEIETDKASMELPSPVSGVLSKQLKPAGEIVPVGAVIALIEERVTAEAAVPPKVAAGHPPAAVAAGLRTGRAGEAPAEPRPSVAVKGRLREPRVMPAARRALAEAGLSPADVQATGPGSRLLKEDVQRHLSDPARDRERGSAGAPPADPNGDRQGAGDAGVAPSAPAGGDRLEEVVPMTMLRRRIAQRLVESQQTTASLTTFNEIDLSAVMTLRKERGEEFQKQHGVKLGFMSFFVKAAIDALKRFPAVNAEIRGTDIVYKNYYDIGIAVSTEHGLVVPVVRNAERLSFAEVELAIADLAARARDRKITVEELQGGTFTITNGGIFGSLLATPIINPPQSAILGLHAIQDRPVAREGQVVIRPMMYVALTYDHRIIDGRESVSFLKRIKECVEDPARMLIEV
ncbi:MAG: 2-oxoglutarate dehydrogenase complex dihydrolipoyllysine-residue succinyltransferase [Planctomycetota bacterium]